MKLTEGGLAKGWLSKPSRQCGSGSCPSPAMQKSVSGVGNENRNGNEDQLISMTDWPSIQRRRNMKTMATESKLISVAASASIAVILS